MSAVQTGTLWRVASTQMPTRWGMYDAIGFERDVSKGGVETALALVMGDLTAGVPNVLKPLFCLGAEIRSNCRLMIQT